MPIITTKCYVYLVQYQCPQEGCVGGMVYTNQPITGNIIVQGQKQKAAGFVHKCPKCGHTEVLPKIYPNQELQLVKNGQKVNY